jgi:anaerobic magnesium-protoporphyrin IX monomethyl ester cyclase
MTLYYIENMKIKNNLINKPFKVLFIYPNAAMMNPAPISIGIFTAILKEKGVNVDLFDTTFYRDKGDVAWDKSKEALMQVLPADDSIRESKIITTDMEQDLRNKVDEFKPDFIMISVLELSMRTAARLLKAIRHYDVPVLAGGVLAYSAPELVLNNKDVDYVGLGEGEGLVADICVKFSKGEDICNIDNLAYIEDGVVIKNKLRALEDVNNLPIADFSLFKPERLLRPMGGKVWITLPIETNRGCPYKCTFCNSPFTLKMYKDDGQGFFRKKTAETIDKELDYLIRRHNINYIYFTSDTFIIFNNEEFDLFCQMYEKYRLPFWIQTRAETITKERVERLAEIGLHRMSMGLEHGNEEFRKNVIKKPFDNETMIEATRIVTEAGIPLTVNNIIAFPGETRELVFDTIELNRNLKFESINCVPFAPFHGTDLQKLAVKLGYVEENHTPGSLNMTSPMDQPQLPAKEVQGLVRTFPMYVRFPKEHWPIIKKAEQDDDIYESLRKEYKKQFFNIEGDEDELNFDKNYSVLEGHILSNDDITTNAPEYD